MPEDRDIRVCEAANTPVERSSEKKVLRQQDGEASPRQVLLEVKDLEVTYGSGRKAFKAVNRANFEIYKGETFGLVGESGSGKTTIGRAIMRILPTSGGEILYKGQKINGKISRQLDQQVIKEIQMIFQDPQSSLNERAKVSYIVGEGLQNVRPDLTAAQREEKVRQALLDVGLLPEFASRFPHEFSGGQRQRVGIARALALNPEFIVCDEPISALDVSIQAQVVNMLMKFQEEMDLTYLFIAHDLSMVRHIADQTAVMYLGTMVEYGSTRDVYEHPVHPYTRGLLSAVPVADPDYEKAHNRIPMDGEVPSPINPKPGCRFCARCRKATAQCHEETPKLRDVGGGHMAACWNL